MENEFWHKVLKVIVILALGALAVYITVALFPFMLWEDSIRLGFFDVIFIVLILPIVFIIIGIIRSWK